MRLRATCTCLSLATLLNKVVRGAGRHAMDKNSALARSRVSGKPPHAWDVWFAISEFAVTTVRKSSHPVSSATTVLTW